MKPLRCGLAVISFLIMHLAAAAQDDLVHRVQKAAQEEMERSMKKYRLTSSIRRQQEMIEEERNTLLRANTYLKEGLDTNGLHGELQQLEAWHTAAVEGIIPNTGQVQTYRNLTTSYNILLELSDRAALRKAQIDRYAIELEKFRYRIDSLNADSALYSYSTDSAELVRYFSKYIYVAREMGHVDSAIDNAIITAGTLQTQINGKVYQINASLAVVGRYVEELSDNNVNREMPDLWQQANDHRPLGEVLHFSKIKGILTLCFYSEQNAIKVVSVLLLILLSTIFLRALKRKLRQGEASAKDVDGRLSIRYPLVTALILVPSLFQFIFIYPPYIFGCLFAVVPAVLLPAVFKKYISVYWMRWWMVMTGLFLLACIDNLILQETRLERWFLFLIALAGLLTAASTLPGRKTKILRERLIVYFIGAHILLEAASLWCNLYGRYNLSKVFMICGYLCIIEGIVFLWVVRLINETLSLASDVYKGPEMRSFYINFSRVGNRAPTLLYVLVVVGWVVVCGRSFYAYQRLSQPVARFFLDERQVGNYSFSIGNLLLFFLIISLSVIASRIVSFFASDNHMAHDRKGKDRKPGLGSWLLLVRVTIICLGLFLALAATGFPMDRLTIVVGALGVGIGLGLQTLINNLVSGLIIAFEKPVNVGDRVDLGDMSGTMKSIGFRSSVITTTKGADLVIPNGDLLNSRMVNWTTGGGRRLVDMTARVAYGTDLGAVKSMLMQLLQDEQRILAFPSPQVVFIQLGNSAIDVQLVFWVKSFVDMTSVKSDIIELIDRQFREKGIVIPLPQQEIYLHREQEKEANRDHD